MSTRAPQTRQTRPRAALPTRAGVGPSCVALPEGPWLSMLDFLSQRFPGVSREAWRERMARGDVVDASGVPVDEARAFRAHGRLYYYRTSTNEPASPLSESILYQDDDLVVADKPHFMAVVPAGPYLNETLLVRLKQRLGIDALVPIHRIDRDTAGVVMFSARPATRDAYQRLFREQRVRKTYHAVVPFPTGQPLPDVYRSRLVDGVRLRMREEPGPPNSETHFHLLESRGAFARLELSPISGRKHQLRVHCAALGMPIVNDRMYPELMPIAADDRERPLQLLAKSIAFCDPFTGQSRAFLSARELQLPLG